MPKSHAKFHSANGKRQVLVAEDELVNREILRGILADEYELVFASDGAEALDLMQAHKDTLSLVLLDLIMPEMSGIEVLRKKRANPDLARIPVIVLTADQDAEVESLMLGAFDFIPKPYPRADVILARVLRIIELSEDRDILGSTERDELTGLYNHEFFFRYAEQYDQYHQDVEMDAIVLDINHFHMINERFGTEYGNSVLRRVGEALLRKIGTTSGIVCRREADTFLVYCPSGIDYEDLFESASVALSDDDAYGERVWLRMGVYANVDKSLDIERCFDRAKTAADTVHGSFTKRIGMYDDALHDEELYIEQLIGDFPTALKERQFKVHYQPKFAIQSEKPTLASAEALVRWQHPTLGLISPGVFVPLFEENGLIQALDSYVWNEAASQMKDWRKRLDVSVPVSVNVSRIDLYDPHVVDTLLDVLHRNELDPSDLLLEVTESAYTQDSGQIIDTVNILRGLGFRIEMDDFGTGYSSLNMVSSMPIDALKLDMQFIRTAFTGRKDTKMLEVIIDIADYLSVPVIAEGVETEEQLVALREMGCDYVQGFFFSKPVPVEQFDRFLTADAGVASSLAYDKRPAKSGTALDKSPSGEIAKALTSGFDVVFYVDVDSDLYVQFGRRPGGSLHVVSRGGDFFGAVHDRILQAADDNDRERVALSLSKEVLLERLAEDELFGTTYRILSGDAWETHTLKVVKAASPEERYIVCCISGAGDSGKPLEGSAK